jgi:hypothetical protein
MHYRILPFHSNKDVVRHGYRGRHRRLPFEIAEDGDLHHHTDYSRIHFGPTRKEKLYPYLAYCTMNPHFDFSYS